MVRKKDQIVYKLPDNVQVSSISEEQRKRLMEEIQSLHAATMLAAAQQQQQVNMPMDNNKPIAPKTDALVLNTPPQPTPAEADAIKETARKLREELEQQQQLMLLQQRLQQQGMKRSGMYEATSPPDSSKGPRKYIKTGKYSKKKQLQGLLPQSPQHQQQPNLFNIQSVSADNSNNNSATTSAASTPVASTTDPVQLQQTQKPIAAAKQQDIRKFPQTLPDSILSKRLPEEEFQHREIKRRFLDTLSKDHVAVTNPDYKTPFKSLEDAINRLLPYHIYHYPKTDLDANRISVELQDSAILDIFKCQSDLFEKHKKMQEKLEKSDETLSMKILIGRQVMSDQRQKLAEEQARVSAEQAAQAAYRKEQQRLQTEKAQLAALVGQQLPPGFDTMGMF
ncbi:hypothetical protein BCV72DRAFT_212887 [Rhizopus microsporus var. microsporus]|uniref:GLTSCR protein conserved domain-containing protein n=1 Tax=Rhizopus microsporus var. microsporus TaxID=86635 RepID=A0A1X0QV69_RHIZD|nr:hypothetical protein BCV72DRAFT_212887 [Rhizopus microsporus var. microsporus]